MKVVYVLQAKYSGGRTYDPRNARTESGVRWLDYELPDGATAVFEDQALAIEAAEMKSGEEDRLVRVVARTHHPVVAEFNRGVRIDDEGED